MEESAVKVCVRIRPLIQREGGSAENPESVPLFWKADKKTVYQIEDGNVTKSFNFDRVFIAEESTSQLYQEIAKPLVVSAVEGYNGTIFAYGQTSSGKTFTMMGSDHTPGVIPQAMDDVFQTIINCPNKEFLLRVSCMEIYNETVTDLLCESWKRKPLEIREGNYKNVYVADLTEELVTNAEQALAWIRKGEKNRHYGKTKMNQRSSRSHTIFRMILESRERTDSASGDGTDGAIIVSQLNLVDLAGAERASQTGAEGVRFKEGCNINRSLFTLGQVIKKLTDENQGGFTNYRDSKLTRILQNSLGGNAKTIIICTVTPAAGEETLSTLQFASEAKRMKNDPHVIKVSDDGALLKRYRNEIADLKRCLLEVSSVTRTTATEKEVLAQLLQEKDQLQREQEDRIKNLTKLIVTSSNSAVAEKRPKRRVTWGGELQGSAKSPDLHSGDSGFGFAGHLAKNRSAGHLTVLTEEDCDGDSGSPWGMPEELPFHMEIQSDMTRPSFLDGKVLSPGWRRDSSEKLASLELQLQMEAQQKQEAVERVAALEKLLEGRAQENPQESQEECKKDLGETIQLCEALVSEKATIAAERDLIEQEFYVLREENQALRQEKEQLLKEIEEKREVEEFNSLEQESTKQYENELLSEISSLKKEMENLQADLTAMSTDQTKKEHLIAELRDLSGKDSVQHIQQLTRSLVDAEALSRDTKREWAILRSENLSLKERDVAFAAGCEKMETEMKALHSQLEAEKSRSKTMQADLQRELQGALEENIKLTALLDGKVPRNATGSVELERTIADLKTEQRKSHKRERALQAKVDELQHLITFPVKVDSLLEQVRDLTEKLCAAKAESDVLALAQAGQEAEVLQLQEEVQLAQERLTNTQARLSHAELNVARLTEQNLDVAGLVAQPVLHAMEKDQLPSFLEECNLKVVKDNAKELVGNPEPSKCSEDPFENNYEGLHHQIKRLSDLERFRSERDSLLSDSTVSAQRLEEDLEKLHAELNSLTEERDQLQEILEGVREERSRLKRDLQENMEMIALVQEELRQQQHLYKEHQALSEKEQTQLQQQIKQLGEELEGVRAEKSQLQRDLEGNVEMMIENQEELRVVQENLRDQRKAVVDLEVQITNMECKMEKSCNDLDPHNLKDMQDHIKRLSDELEVVRNERDSLLSESSVSAQRPEEDLEKMMSLTEERDQLQEILEGVREERSQLERDLLEHMEMIQQLWEELEGVGAERSQLKAQLEQASFKLLSREEEEMHFIKQRGSQTEGLQRLRSRLDQSKCELQELLEKFRQFGNRNMLTSESLPQPLKNAMLAQNDLIFPLLPSLQKPIRRLYVNFHKSMSDIRSLQWQAMWARVAYVHRQHFVAQAQMDTACFKERRLQGLLQRRAHAQRDSLDITEDGFHEAWDTLISELLEKREQDLRKMKSVYEELEEAVAQNVASLTEELLEQERTTVELRALITATTLDLTALELLLVREGTRRATLAESQRTLFQQMKGQYSQMERKLQELGSQVSLQLEEERSRSLALLQDAQGQANVQASPQLLLKLKQSEEQIEVLQKSVKELLDARVKAEDRVSTHKEATHLLQTELQEVSAQLMEKENEIQALKDKLNSVGQVDRRVELEELKNKLFKLELERTSLFTKHQDEMKKMKDLLDYKEESMRKLRETLRKTQQHSADSFIVDQGTPGKVHCTTTLEKEEGKRLKNPIARLDSHVTSEHEEVSKGRRRATKHKENKRELMNLDRLLSPLTPTRRRCATPADVQLFDSPKSKFFDIQSDSLSVSCPQRFFDNSCLGTLPDLSTTAEDRNAEWWPLSPKRDDNCKAQ